MRRSTSGGTHEAATSEEPLARPIPLNIQVGHENVSFFCPSFLGHPKARAAASKASGCFMGGTHDVCDLNHRLASSEASVGRNVALREILGSFIEI